MKAIGERPTFPCSKWSVNLECYQLKLPANVQVKENLTYLKCIQRTKDNRRFSARVRAWIIIWGRTNWIEVNRNTQPIESTERISYDIKINSYTFTFEFYIYVCDCCTFRFFVFRTDCWCFSFLQLLLLLVCWCCFCCFCWSGLSLFSFSFLHHFFIFHSSGCNFAETQWNEK